MVSKIFVIGLERDLRAASLGRPRGLQFRQRRAALVALLIHLAVAPDLEIQRFRQGVHHRYADAVQPAGHLVAVVVELSAGVQNGQDDFGGRLAARMQIDRDAAAVVDRR